MYKIVFTKAAEKDKKLLKAAHLENRVKVLLDLISKDPFIYPPSYEKLVADLKGKYSRRINIHHRLVYKVDEEKKIIVVLAFFTHYRD